jgi:hypothetical protein
VLTLWRGTALVSTKFWQAPHFPAKPLLEPVNRPIDQPCRPSLHVALTFFQTAWSRASPALICCFVTIFDQTGRFDVLQLKGAYLSPCARRRFTLAMLSCSSFPHAVSARIPSKSYCTCNKVSGKHTPDSKIHDFSSWEGPVGVYDILLIHD